MESTIVCPVSRSLPVADLDRTVAFYRDVLGFELRGESLISGPAELYPDQQQSTPEMFYFEVADVDALHTAISARGGHPGIIGKVNWIKIRMFQITDPTGNVLLFGKSFNFPDPAKPAPMLEKALPEMPLDDVAAGVAYYRDVLGFKINYQQHDLGVMDRDSVTLVLIARTTRHEGIGSAYIYIADADALYAELKSRGADIRSEPVSRPWGLRDFRVWDPEGNQITFGQPFE
jgi:predicted enzyme related to lactoylglutathione lyase